ncbi:MAG: hypothetical protein A3F90_03860 [Deltaproteobacteria bacterium RIFCSPLOWO2_12_FULL_60_19]|nr:MAG: hypothetical protein A3F90_03860 [Deltaproteobacteria bacterium RIFCSPLOWO2_12_FULL_60_19]
MPPPAAGPAAHGFFWTPQGFADWEAQGLAEGLTAHGLTAQGFELLTAQGLAVALTAHGLLTVQGFTGFTAQGFAAGAQGLEAFGAQGFLTAHGLAAADEPVPEILAANCSEGPSRVMAKSHGRSENSPPLSQVGPGSQQ